LRWPGRHIRWKIILPYALLVVVLAGVQTYVATNLVEGNLDERFENQLLEASRAASDSVVRREQAHLEVARTVAFSRGLATDISSGDERSVSTAIHNIAANTGAEHIEVLTPSGERLAAVQLIDAAQLQYATAAPDDPTAWPLVGLVLGDEHGRKFAQVIETGDGTCY
jgi:C4-dicarboxylate-specific signal transduction histidine kinase